MSKFMKMLNNISRSQAIYRLEKIKVEDLQPTHYAFVLSICRMPGCSQEDLARELCVNKSTVARNLNYLEEKDYIRRESSDRDKRQFSVYPTEKMLSAHPKVKKASKDWMQLLSQGISKEELDIFNRVLKNMEAKAREIIEKGEDNK